ncbi:MAG: phosphatase [Lachnospiraceae bacterium]|nr:phosphatase [Lachnospiraceae bacterium]
MRIVADTHTHTLASTHAYGTAKEMIQEAADLGLYAIALTDHGPNMPGSPRTWYFDNLSAIPSTYLGVRVLKGAEANIADFDGRLDIAEYLQERLEWIVASLHNPTLDTSVVKPTVETCTELYLNVAKNPYVNVIGHSGTPEYEYDYERVIPVFAENGKLVEINNSTFRNKKGSMSNCVEIAKICKKVGASVIINTDAHFMTQLGRADEAIQMLKEIDFPEELVVNSSVELFNRYLIQHNISLY